MARCPGSGTRDYTARSRVRGQCSQCGGTFKLTLDGVLRVHMPAPALREYFRNQAAKEATK